MKPYLFDIETSARPESDLLNLMPFEIRNPREPDLSLCPEYRGDFEKQNAWKEKTRSEFALKAAEAKQKWLGDAALHAPRGQVRLIGIRDMQEKFTHCIICDAISDEIKKIMAPDRTWPCKVNFIFQSETQALGLFYEFVNTKIGDNAKGTFIGYYITGFDFPFLFRRAMILGAKIAKKLRKGRYWDNNLYIDLDEEYKMGERELKIGGLDGLAQILSCKRKIGTGEGFYRLWQSDPIAALMYHLNEMDTLEECSQKMGII